MSKLDFAKRNEEMVRLFKEGYTQPALGKRYGITRERVRQIVSPEGQLDGRKIRRDRAQQYIRAIVSSPREKIGELARKFRFSPSAADEIRSHNHCAVKKSHAPVYLGHKTEEHISNLLSENGIQHKLMPNGCPHDIETGNGLRIDVKGCYARKTVSKRQKSPLYSFCVRKDEKGDYCDFFILFVKETGDVFVVPNDEVGYVSRVYVGYPDKRQESWIHAYKDRYDLLGA